MEEDLETVKFVGQVWVHCGNSPKQTINAMQSMPQPPTSPCTNDSCQMGTCICTHLTQNTFVVTLVAGWLGNVFSLQVLGEAECSLSAQSFPVICLCTPRSQILGAVIKKIDRCKLSGMVF